MFMFLELLDHTKNKDLWACFLKEIVPNKLKYLNFLNN